MVENNAEVGSLTLRNVSLGDDGVKQLTGVLKSSENVRVGHRVISHSNIFAGGGGIFKKNNKM